MKLLLIVAVLWLALWLWRSKRVSNSGGKQRQSRPAPAPQDMISCTLCSLHVPVADAVQGKKGIYCSPDHLHRAEP
jgi:uncharacterized protein